MLLPQLPAGYLWLPSVTRYCRTLCMLLHDSMLYTWSTVTTVTWWLPSVTRITKYYGTVDIQHIADLPKLPLLPGHVTYCFPQYLAATVDRLHT